MINIIIYLDEKDQAEELVKGLLKSGLAASASIDSDNSYYIIDKGEVSQTTHTVITAQTKALLFSRIELFVLDKIGVEVPIFSLPITQTNQFFDKYIRERTLKT
jgi:uncharacterized protein involved in tolerance to divalent cations